MRNRPDPTATTWRMWVVLSSMYDAWAAYDDTALATEAGADLRRPPAQRMAAAQRDAVSYAAHNALSHVFPRQRSTSLASTWRSRKPSPFEMGPSRRGVLRWPTFQAAADEAGVSRLYGGIHFQDGDLRGRALGAQVGRQALAAARAIWDPDPVTAPP